MNTITLTDEVIIEGHVLAARKSSPVGLMTGRVRVHGNPAASDELVGKRRRIQHIIFDRMGMLVLDPLMQIANSLCPAMLTRNYMLADAVAGVAARCDFEISIAQCDMQEDQLDMAYENFGRFGLTKFIFPEYGDLGHPSRPDVVTGMEATFLDSLQRWAATWRREQRNPPSSFRPETSEGRHATIRGTSFDPSGRRAPGHVDGSDRAVENLRSRNAVDPGEGPMGCPVGGGPDSGKPPRM